MQRVASTSLVGAIALLLAAAPSAVHAQGYFQLGVGASIPMGDLKDAASTGYLAQAAAGFGKGVVGGRISTSYIRHGLKGTDHNFRIIGAMADLVVSPKSGGNAKPYLLGGAGVQNEGSNVTGSTSETKFAWNAGAGIEMKMSGLGLYVEAKYMSIKHDQSSTNLVPITVGLKFGGN